LSDNIKTSNEIQKLTESSKLDYYLSEANAVQTPFIVLAILLFVLAIIVLIVKLPQILNTASNTSYGQVLKHKKLSLGAVGIFLYVGAEVTIGTCLVNYFMDMNMADIIIENSFLNNIASSILNANLNTIDSKGIVATFVVFYWSGAMIGRFVGSYLTKIIHPQKVLSYFAIGAVFMILISMSTSGITAMTSILAVGLFNSIMFPTIFSIAINDLGKLKLQGSGILCTAIVGGAFIPPLYGLAADLSGFKIAFFVVILCYSYIYFYSKRVNFL